MPGGGQRRASVARVPPKGLRSPLSTRSVSDIVNATLVVLVGWLTPLNKYRPLPDGTRMDQIEPLAYVASRPPNRAYI
jgi:hypothetical protein